MDDTVDPMTQPMLNQKYMQNRMTFFHKRRRWGVPSQKAFLGGGGGDLLSLCFHSLPIEHRNRRPSRQNTPTETEDHPVKTQTYETIPCN